MKKKTSPNPMNICLQKHISLDFIGAFVSVCHNMLVFHSTKELKKKKIYQTFVLLTGRYLKYLAIHRIIGVEETLEVFNSRSKKGGF